MKIKTSQQRWWILGIAMALTLLAIYLVQTPEAEDVVESISTRSGKRDLSLRIQKSALPVQTSAEDKILLPDLTQKHLFVEDKTNKNLDLFKGHAWYVPPPPPPPPPVPVKLEPPPAAPPVPFFYIGKLEQVPQGTQVFLTSNNKVLSVTLGKNVDTLWRLDKEDANTLTFTYLPLGLTKVLSKAVRQPR